MKFDIARGSTSTIIHVFIQDSTSTAGAGKTGLAFNTASLACKKIRDGETLSASVTIEDITTLGTYAAPTSNAHVRFKEVNSASPTQGLYEIHLHNDWVDATNARRSLVICLGGATGMAQIMIEIVLYDAVRGKAGTAVPNAVAGADGGLLTCTNANVLPANAIVAGSIASNALTSAKLADGLFTAAKFATDFLAASGFSQAAIDKIFATPVPGGFGSGTLGKVVGDNLNATVSSRATDAGTLTQVNAGLDTAISELSQGVPVVTPSLRTAIMYWYMAMRNQQKSDRNTGLHEIYNDAGTRITKAPFSDTGNIFTRSKAQSGV